MMFSLMLLLAARRRDLNRQWWIWHWAERIVNRPSRPKRWRRRRSLERLRFGSQQRRWRGWGRQRLHCAAVLLILLALLVLRTWRSHDANEWRWIWHWGGRHINRPGHPKWLKSRRGFRCFKGLLKGSCRQWRWGRFSFPQQWHWRHQQIQCVWRHPLHAVFSSWLRQSSRRRGRRRRRWRWRW